MASVVPPPPRLETRASYQSDGDGMDPDEHMVSVSSSTLSEIADLLPFLEEGLDENDGNLGVPIIQPTTPGRQRLDEAKKMLKRLKIDVKACSPRGTPMRDHFVNYSKFLNDQKKAAAESKDVNSHLMIGMAQVAAQILPLLAGPGKAVVKKIAYPVMRGLTDAALNSITALKTIAPTIISILSSCFWPLESMGSAIAGNEAMVAITIMSFILWLRHQYPRWNELRNIEVEPATTAFLESQADMINDEWNADKAQKMIKESIERFKYVQNEKENLMIAQDLVIYIYKIYGTVENQKERDELKIICDDALNLMKIIALGVGEESNMSMINTLKKILSGLGRKVAGPVGVQFKKFNEQIKAIQELKPKLKEAQSDFNKKKKRPDQQIAYEKSNQNLIDKTNEFNAAVVGMHDAQYEGMKGIMPLVPGSLFVKGALKGARVGATAAEGVYQGLHDTAARVAGVATAAAAGSVPVPNRGAVRLARNKQQARIEERRKKGKGARRAGAQGGSRRRKKSSRKQRNKRKTIRRKVVKKSLRKSVRKKSLRKTKKNKRKTKRMRR